MEEDYLERLVMENTSITPHWRKNLYVEMSHGVKVSNLAAAVARELGEDCAFCEDISVAGLLHDIGKLWVTRYLEDAQTETTLSIERMKIVRMHPTHSREVLETGGYSKQILDAVYFHHENMDGSGYPENLSGEQIPWMARILRICDVFCALTSDRNYRRAFDMKSAVEIMIDEAENYDMQIFLAFQRVLHSEESQNLDMLSTVLTPLQKKHLRFFVTEGAKNVYMLQHL